MSEASMQRSVRDWVYGEYGKCTVDLKGKRTGCVRILKLSTLAMYGEAGWMDLCFWVLGGYVFLIEMKKLGKEASEAQAQKARELRSLGFNVYLEDTVEGAKATAKREIDAALERYRISQKVAPKRRRAGKGMRFY